MPIYEYLCHACGRRSSFFVRRIGAPVEAVCQHCGSREMSRLFSRVAVLRSEEQLLEGMAEDPSLADVDETDPLSMARWIRRLSRRLGQPLDAEMEAELERMEAGEMPGEGEEDSPEEETTVDEE
jgi:putative FmdB family regulatory protein